MIKNKAGFIGFIILMIALLTIEFAVFRKGYKSATDKYESTIKELEEENERLSDPTTQYELASKEINIDLMNSEVKNIGELATIEYLYTDAGKFEDVEEIFGTEIPFTKKSFIVKWDGILKAGVKVDEIAVELNDGKKEIIVHIPKAEILSHEIDNQSIETLDEKNGLFNSVKVDDVREFDAVSKESMEERAIENGILEKAFENAKEIIHKIVYTDLVKKLEYDVRFEVIE